ncbi:response regulator [Rhodohalobacter sp. 8-1]|uniref:response regulator n=1 Tax=Rhodohalobacter sp. 8-1 TaxID=3131972 RepID=UPI0030EF207A
MTTPKRSIKLLLVDDSVDDRELILMNLRRGGYVPDVHSVDTKDGFVGALQENSCDLIICDYSMPGFDGLTALAILKEHNLDIPFILVSGAIGEELAVKAMKAGANDYMMKDNLQRLVPAIERELKEAKLREKHRQAQIERDRLLTVIQNSLNEIYIFDCRTLKYRYLNEAALNNLGYDEDDVHEMTPIDINPYLETPDDFNRIIQPLLDGKLDKDLYLTKHIRKDGTTYPIEIHLQLIRQNDQQFFTAIGFDLTDREKDARRIKEQKDIAREMAEHSKHKSEFLANMSHELRTPLNSILLLSKLLLKSKSGNLTGDQQKYIDVIQESGKNLLSLINEILDLSKIESGEMELSFETIELKSLVANVSDVFEPIADEKKLDFSVTVYDNCPSRLVSDQLRLEQVLRNLLSNAMKFTQEGRIDLDVFTEKTSSLVNEHQIIFSVKDTGIGIPADKQELVFESFRQADGSTQRKFGGTGLGLSICRHIAELLGGTLTLKSRESMGSTFNLSIPLKEAADAEPQRKHGPERLHQPPDFKDEADRAERMTLISDNRHLISTLTEQIDDHSGTLNVISSGKDALREVARYSPSTVLIDPYASNFSGWSVAKHLLNDNTHEYAIWMITDETHPMPAVDMKGLSGKMSMPLSSQNIRALLTTPPPGTSAESDETERTLLLIDDNKIHNEALSEFAEEIVDRCLIATTAREAFETLEAASVNCIVLDLTLPDANGQDVLLQLSDDPKLADIPVIIYSGRSLTNHQKEELLTHASDVILKNIGSHSRLMSRISELIQPSDKTEKPEASISTSQQQWVLLVDDDDQSYFSISSLLENSGRTVRRAENGHEALRMLQTHKEEIGLVLLDLMMPEMDGFETIEKIRQNPSMRDLPVFIVTAKAMKGDREECLKHGATDYISKPISPEKLETLLSIWAS